jgi:septum formation protein
MLNQIILASASPRRKDLLAAAGVAYEVRIPEVDETPIKNEAPKKMVARLSQAKAAKIAAEIIHADSSAEGRGAVSSVNDGSSRVILAADTTVVSHAQKNLGKPENEAEAKKMIQALQGKPHHVLTGYSLFQVKGKKVVKKITRVVRTDVYIKKLSKTEIEQYVNRGESLDKAGAYAAQGFGMALIEKINGSYTNVVGLPIAQVMEDLKKLGYRL